MQKYTFRAWLLASPLIAGAIAWVVQWTLEAGTHCAFAKRCEIMPSHEGSKV
jgi:hypothetical protein